MNTTPIDFIALIIGIGGGLTLFLYGMRKMSDALKTAAGGGMKTLLERLTTNRFTAILSGALVTAVVQSSSVTTVMVVGFISAGLINFTQSVGVIMGANIGTTLTAQIIAFKITKYALVMIAVGFLLEILAKSQRVRQYGIALMGLGLIFFGMELMSNTALPLRSYQPFIELMQEMRNPLLGVAAGAVFTALVQSSSATTGIVIVLAAQGFITLEAGIALILGANVGTCVTAMLATIGKPREAVKAGVVHVIFNLVGVLLLVGLIPWFAELVRWVSPVSTGLSGVQQLAVDVPRQIANAHTLFNIGNTLIFLAFMGLVAQLVDRLVPAPKVQVNDAGRAVYLDELYLAQPDIALDQAKRELDRLGKHVAEMMKQALPTTLAGTEKKLERLQKEEENVDTLYGEIVGYLGTLSLHDLIEPQAERIQVYIGIANYLENTADVVGTNFVANGRLRIESGWKIDETTQNTLSALETEALETFEHTLRAFEIHDPALAANVLASKDAFNRHVDQIRLQLIQQAARAGKAGVKEYHYLLALLEDIKRFHTLSRRIARFLTEPVGASASQNVALAS